MATERNNVVDGKAFLLLLLITSTTLRISAGKALVGVDLGLNGDLFPNISFTMNLLRNLHTGAVRLYDSNPVILRALSTTLLEVIVSVRNDELAAIATSPSAADIWVQTFVTPFYPTTKITHIAVGNEVLRFGNFEAYGEYLTQALQNIYSALVSRKLHDLIKVVSPLSGDILASSWPPTSGTFKELQFVLPVLQFLRDTGSTFFINLYPYSAYIENSLEVSFEFATFQRTTPAFFDPVSFLPYSNLFESMLDATYNAMATLGFSNMSIAVGQTGWPTAGGNAATVQNAELFNKNLLKYVYNQGTPQRPDIRTPVFIFALFNENLNPGPETDQHWGIFNADGTVVYAINLGGG